MHSSTLKQESDNQDALALAQSAAGGDKAARRKLNELVDPMIRFQTDCFCKRFCGENKFHYRCTLTSPWGNAPADALLCEWGNASYAWMLDDLTNENRLRRFEGKQGARLQDYLYRIANSLPFYERWKDWRFGRRVHVPDYIKDIAPLAAKIFFALRQGNTIAMAAQNLGITEQLTETVAQKIIVTLTKRKRLHLLNPDREQSLSSLNRQQNGDADETIIEMEIPSEDIDPELLEQNEQLKNAWQQLEPVEQFVIEATVIEDQDANDILHRG